MKRIICLLLLLTALRSNSQSLALLNSSRGFFNNATVTVSNATYTAGNTYVFFIGTRANAVTPTDNPTVSSGSLVLTKQGTVASGDKRIIVYTTIPSSTVTTPITFTYAQAQQVHTYLNYVGTSMGAFTSISVASNIGSSTNPSIVLPVTSSSYTCSYFLNNLNPFGGTPESGWTENTDSGNGDGPTGTAGYHRNNTTDNTIDVTAATSNWLGIAVQFSASSRRVFIQ